MRKQEETDWTHFQDFKDTKTEREILIIVSPRKESSLENDTVNYEKEN